MNNARKTFNHWINDNVLPALPAGWKFQTGDEPDPTIKPNTLTIRWINGHRPGMRGNSRIRLAQLEVFVTNQDTSGAEAAADTILKALRLYTGVRPVLDIPKFDYSGSSPVALGTDIIVRRQMEGGWNEVEPPQEAARLYILTLDVDYIPG